MSLLPALAAFLLEQKRVTLEQCSRDAAIASSTLAAVLQGTGRLNPAGLSGGSFGFRLRGDGGRF
jgi:hypothetical protein